MFKSEQSRDHALECLRLESDCRELAAKSQSRKLRSHFVRMAQAWSTLAASEPSEGADLKFHQGKPQST